jgi:hypothetical protein
LSQVATSCGWKPATKLQVADVTPSPKTAATPSKVSLPKGKDRKLAREAAKLKSFTPEPVPEPAQQLPTLKYQITTKQLLEQVAVVAEAKVGEIRYRILFEGSLRGPSTCVNDVLPGFGRQVQQRDTNHQTKDIGTLSAFWSKQQMFWVK